MLQYAALHSRYSLALGRFQHGIAQHGSWAFGIWMAGIPEPDSPFRRSEACVRYGTSGLILTPQPRIFFDRLRAKKNPLGQDRKTELDQGRYEVQSPEKNMRVTCT